MLMSAMFVTLLQDSESLSAGNSRLLMIFVGVVAFSTVAQAIIFAVIAIGAQRTQKKLMAKFDELTVKAHPLMDQTRTIIDDLKPKIKTVTENAVEISHTVREKVQEFGVTASDVNLKTRTQVDRACTMVSSALTATGEIAGTIHHSIRVPVREVAGIVNGLKAGIDVLFNQAKGFSGFPPRARATQASASTTQVRPIGAPTPQPPAEPQSSTRFYGAKRTGQDTEL